MMNMTDLLTLVQIFSALWLIVFGGKCIYDLIMVLIGSSKKFIDKVKDIPAKIKRRTVINIIAALFILLLSLILLPIFNHPIGFSITAITLKDGLVLKNKETMMHMADWLTLVQIFSALWLIVFGGKCSYDLIRCWKDISKVLIDSSNTFIDKVKHLLAKIKRGTVINIVAALFVLLLSLILPPFFNHPTGFSIMATTLKDGQALANKKPVIIPVTQIPLTITGTYFSQGTGHVWVVVEEAAGYYYLQSIPVRFADDGVIGQWRAPNVYPSVKTTRINFVSVTSQGDDIFQNMIKDKRLGAFTLLPNGSQILKTVQIHVSAQ